MKIHVCYFNYVVLNKIICSFRILNFLLSYNICFKSFENSFCHLDSGFNFRANASNSIEVFRLRLVAVTFSLFSKNVLVSLVLP